MNYYLLFILFTLNSLTLSDARQLFGNAGSDESAAEKFFEIAEKYSGTNTTLLAYKGAAYAIKAKFSKGLMDKKELFKTGAGLIENSAKKEPANFEIRMIRLGIQINAPKITGYQSNISEDKTFLLKEYKNQPANLKNLFKDFTKKNDIYTPEELKTIQ